jgi:SAM-dependent methyltransferase
MTTQSRLITATPEFIKNSVRPIRNRFGRKSDAELSYWRSRFQIDNGHFQNSWYERLMLAMAGETNDEFLKGKIVADFGCGPRGSLVWAGSALLRIGIDVLADRYADEFSDDMISHSMIYLKSTEKVIPLPSCFIDVIFTLNAMDHVNQFGNSCDEIVRILKPGGAFIGSLNLEEPPSPCEPQLLTEKVIRQKLLSRLEVQSYRLAQKGSNEDVYASFFNGGSSYRRGQAGVLWVRATKPS